MFGSKIRHRAGSIYKVGPEQTSIFMKGIDKVHTIQSGCGCLTRHTRTHHDLYSMEDQITKRNRLYNVSTIIL